MSARFAGFVGAGLAFLVSAGARADALDPALERLVVNGECRDALGRMRVGAPHCVPDNRAFARLVNQYGFAFAPTAMHSARTTGFGGFHLALEASFTTISGDASYWKLGTQGPNDPSTNAASTINQSPPSALELYSLKLQKGLGFGFEVTGIVGFMPKSSILSGGADVRWSLLEGFRTGALGILPDFAVGGGVRTITGTPELDLTVASVDAQISKPLTIADASVLTPWLGYQYIWIFGDSGVIDQTPGTDAFGYCGYTGSNVPGNADPNKKASDGSSIYDGKPVCTATGAQPQADFNNNAVFNSVRLRRPRLLVGVSYRYEMVQAGAEFITDVVAPEDAQGSAAKKELLRGQARQWTLAFELGAMF